MYAGLVITSVQILSNQYNFAQLENHDMCPYILTMSYDVLTIPCDILAIFDFLLLLNNSSASIVPVAEVGCKQLFNLLSDEVSSQRGIGNR